MLHRLGDLIIADGFTLSEVIGRQMRNYAISKSTDLTWICFTFLAGIVSALEFLNRLKKN